ncbi:TIGR04222 domain-containing membrane protein [Actinokineospora auranticolor]|uniref:Uncharacterized protein (TIGR04222 family) n=1 Tax=Actinokineospora auranticolor TaxID=155976 RepID=A0A2S6GPP1_9PSEU|nr:TIGR04222 domain-containing membrane protein [Actinokineospora auranticolor]PPK67198.1 uncharacterized protein (TIGR04222 family) [Actinokineospora auranticolor]
MLWAWVVVFVLFCAPPAWLIRRDRVRARARGRDVVDELRLGLFETALLTGGPARAVDAVVVDLVERGALEVNDTNRISVTAIPEGATAVQRSILAVAMDTAARLPAVRAFVTSEHETVFERGCDLLRDNGLLHTQSGGNGKVLYGYPTAASAVGTALVMGVVQLTGEDWLIDAKGLWFALACTLLFVTTWTLLFIRYGALSSDPRGPLGRACSKVLADRAADNPDLAPWTAVHGLPTSPTTDFRARLRGHATPGAWKMRKPPSTVTDVDEDVRKLAERLALRDRG